MLGESLLVVVEGPRKALTFIFYIITGRCLVTDCSICSDGYAEGFKFVCNTCPDKGGAIVFAAVLTVFFVIGAAAVASYTMSIPLERSGRGAMERMARFIPLQSLKIVIVALQIVTQVNRRSQAISIGIMK